MSRITSFRFSPVCLALYWLLSPSGAVAAELTPSALKTAPVDVPAEGDSVPRTLNTVHVSADAEAEPSEGSGEFAVPSASTALRLELAPRDTPQSLSVVSHERIQAFSLIDSRKLLDNTTGISVERIETERSYYTARGFEIQNFQVDGVGLPFAAGVSHGAQDMAFYDRVEVLRGANGLLSATGTPSATVNFIRKRPSAERQASASVTLGSWQQQRLEGDVSGRLNDSGSLRGRLVGGWEDKASYLDRYHTQKQLAMAIIDADLGPDTRLSVGHSRQHDRPEGVMWGALPLQDSDGGRLAYPRSASSASDWSFWQQNDVQHFLELRHDLGPDWQIKTQLSRRQQDGRAELFYITGQVQAADGSGLGSYPSRYHHDEQQTLADLTLTGRFRLGGYEHQLVAGYQRGRSDNTMRSFDDRIGEPVSVQQMLAGSFPRPDFAVPLSGHADLRDRRDSLYGALRLQLAEPVQLIAGANHTRADSRGELYGDPHLYDSRETLPFLGLSYALGEQVSLYASAAQIFKPQHELDITQQPLAPLQGRNLELGLKADSADGRLSGSLALFKTRQNNAPTYVDFIEGRSVYQGVDATAQGFELEAVGSPTDGWQLSAGYTQFRLDDPQGTKVRRFVPRRSLRLASLWQVPAVADLELGLAIRAQSAIENDATGLRQSGYVLGDVLARYALGRQFMLSATLENATDTAHLNSLQWSQSYYGSPRSLSLRLNWNY